MKIIETKNACPPAGHYSQGIVFNSMLFISGQLGVDKDGNKHLGSVEEETKTALSNLDAILEEAGSDRFHVLKTTVYISDISLWDRVNKVYSEFFKGHKPARAIVPTRELHYGFKVEIEAVAAII